MTAFQRFLAAEWAPYGTLSQDQLEKLNRHYELLLQWNKVLNLTRIERIEDVVRLHYCESLFLRSALPSGPYGIADIGSGAGFPGIPVAVLRPDCSISLIEAHKRKAVFLGEACQSIPNARVVEGRAEAQRGAYDWVISRAVSPKSVLSLACAPSAAILMSASDLPGLPPPGRVIPVPWGEQRIIALFHVEQRGVKEKC